MSGDGPPLPRRLAGRTALVTGASSGIGAHLAGLLAAAGARTVLAARRLERIEDLAGRLSDEGREAAAVAMDVTDAGSVAAAFDRAERHFGTVDTIVANAGISAAGRSTELDPSAVATVFDTNLLGVYLTVREGAKRLIAAGSRERGHGRVLIIGSITAEMTGEGDAAYAASKAGVAHLGRQFAREWVRQGINLNIVQPGYIRTELNADWFDGDGGRAQIAGFPRRRLMDVDALDEPALYFCSDDSRFVTGATLTIDDGQAL
jgi:NAD(P)-dependent dehydrogenase (short-subunit alcohol dehydrogenase family)